MFSFCYLIHYTLSGLTCLSRKWVELACSVRWSGIGGKIGGTGSWNIGYNHVTSSIVLL